MIRALRRPPLVIPLPLVVVGVRWVYAVYMVYVLYLLYVLDPLHMLYTLYPLSTLYVPCMLRMVQKLMHVRKHNTQYCTNVYM